MTYVVSRAIAALVVIGVLAAVWGDTADVRSVVLGLIAGGVVVWAAIANERDPAARP